jgi:polar amino acid transport system substrate-binding protein
VSAGMRARRPARGAFGRRLSLLAAATVVAFTTSCSLAGYPDTPIPTATPTAAPTSGGGATTAPTTCDNALASYAPSGDQPKPGSMPSGSTMRKIADRGRLIAGVSADTYLLGSRNPLNGKIEGFDIDIVKAVAKAIFGDENRYELKVITAAQRIPALQNGDVDIVARNMTITCDRWKQIGFSSEYYRAGQKIMVRRGSKATTLADLAGQKVCAPKATSSMDNLIKLAPKAIPGDDTVLAGLAAQDPYAVVPDQKAFTAEPYGIGVNAKNVDLVRFVNQVLAGMRSDGQWTAIYNRWLSEALGPAPSPPKAVYGRNP